MKKLPKGISIVKMTSKQAKMFRSEAKKAKKVESKNFSFLLTVTDGSDILATRSGMIHSASKANALKYAKKLQNNIKVKLQVA